ncbi:MAG: hypothetical protein PHH66_13430, partial [Flavobacterium sp.]|nr:hypothetical protein [Flavobacterium sp.]
AIKGTLTKIKYPTGGFTTFEYEPVTTETKYLYTGTYMHLYNDTGATMPRNPITRLMDGEGIAYYDQLFNENSDIFPVYMSQVITVSLSINLRSTMFAFSNKDYVYVKMKNIDTNEEVVKKWFFPSQNADYITSFNPILDFSLTKDNRYTFTLGMGKMPGDVLYNSSNMSALLNMIPFDISASFNYIYGIDTYHVNGAGIRIKRIKDFDGVETAPSSNKRFYYSSLKKIMNKETPETDKVITFNPLFHSFYRNKKLCFVDDALANGSSPYPQVEIWAFLNSNSSTLNLPSSDVYAMYPVVTTSLGGDDFEAGAIEKKFRIVQDARPTLFQRCLSDDCIFVNSFINFNEHISTNHSTHNGTLLKETLWDKSAALKKIKETNYSYDYHIHSSQNNLSGKTNGYDVMNGNKEYIGLYNVLSHRTNKILATTKEFVDGIPIAKYLPPFHLYNGWEMDDHDGDGIWNSADEDFITPDEFYTISEEEIEEPFKKIVNTQEITYATNLAGLPKQIITNDSTSGENKVINYYPITTDIASLTGLSSDEIDAYNTLKTQNRISNPIQIENFKNSVLLSKQRFIYNFFDEITPISLHKVKTSKHTSNFEDRIIYNKYDNKGNPVEILLSDKNMFPTVYIWNNQRQPIYKVINATHSSVVNAINAAPIISTDNLYSLTPLQLNPFITLLPNSLTYIYNYDPLTDLLTYSIDPKGNLQTYHYDSFNRLQFVKDAQGNILSENEYHYKN